MHRRLLALLGSPLFVSLMAGAIHAAEKLPIRAVDAPPIRAVDTAYLNREVAPCADFYAFANGAFDRVEIPADRSAFGVNEEIDERGYALLKEILENAARDGGRAGSSAQRLGDFYASGMDEAAINAAGLTPLEPFFAEIATLQTSEQLPVVLGRLHLAGFGAGFSAYVSVDDRNSTAMITRLVQGGCGLPERGYYFDDTPDAQRIREAYATHVGKMLALAGDAPGAAQASAAAIMRLETRLAEASRTLEELQDPQANYHKFKRADLASQFAPFDWPGYFAALGLPAAESEMIVGQPEFFQKLTETMRETPVETWRAYLKWHVLDQSASALGREFEEEDFNFGGRVLSGATEMQPRWKRVLAAVDVAIGEDLGQLYVQRAFTPEAKAKALEMTQFVFAAMRIRIARAGWMSESTRSAAAHKIDTMRVKIGYPDVWRDYSTLTIARQPYLRNVLAARAFEARRQLAKLGQPVDRNEWYMTPQTNNAYYDASQNEFCFPAGILQPPFFDVRADAASNYGAIGATIGHELTHGFDDSGRQYDADGNLKDWWTAEDAAHFDERAAHIVKQYDLYEAVPGVNLNGEQTLGENIADIGGLLVAYDAFRLATVGDPRATLDGFTPEQRFFIAYAQSWRTNMRPERIRFLATADVHSPPRWRVNGTVANIPAFFEAFGCPVPKDMPPSIW